MKIKPGLYQHYKGTLARVLGVARHTETQEEFVVYEHLEKESGKTTLWIRPKKMFLETVTTSKGSVPRFIFLKDK